MEAFLYNSPSRLYVCRVAYSLCLSMKDMSMVLQHSWAPCSAAWRQLAVQSGSAGHHSPPKMRVQGFSNPIKTLPANFFLLISVPSTRQSGKIQLVLNLAGILKNLHIFQGAALDTTGLEETWQHTPLIRALSMYKGCAEC